MEKVLLKNPGAVTSAASGVMSGTAGELDGC